MLRGYGVRLAEEYDYDLYDDQTLSDLQTAINEAKTYRIRSMPLRPTCLAGIVAGTGELFGSSPFFKLTVRP